MALLHLCLELGGDEGFATAAAHFNHGLRPRAATDERFVEAAALSSIFLISPAAGTSARSPALRSSGIEEAARLARYRFLERAAAEAGAARLATGHTMNDQAETVLLRLLRGTGPAGLAGIPTRRGLVIVRPILALERRDVLSYLADRGIAYRRDETNLDTDILRNRVRHMLIPYLEKRFEPAIVRSLARLAKIAGDEEAWLETAAAARMKKLLGGFARRPDPRCRRAPPPAARAGPPHGSGLCQSAQRESSRRLLRRRRIHSRFGRGEASDALEGTDDRAARRKDRSAQGGLEADLQTQPGSQAVLNARGLGRVDHDIGDRKIFEVAEKRHRVPDLEDGAQAVRQPGFQAGADLERGSRLAAELPGVHRRDPEPGREVGLDAPRAEAVEKTHPHAPNVRVRDQKFPQRDSGEPDADVVEDVRPAGGGPRLDLEPLPYAIAQPEARVRARRFQADLLIGNVGRIGQRGQASEPGRQGDAEGRRQRPAPAGGLSSARAGARQAATATRRKKDRIGRRMCQTGRAARPRLISPDRRSSRSGRPSAPRAGGCSSRGRPGGRRSWPGRARAGTARPAAIRSSPRVSSMRSRRSVLQPVLDRDAEAFLSPPDVLGRQEPLHGLLEDPLGLRRRGA